MSQYDFFNDLDTVKRAVLFGLITLSKSAPGKKADISILFELVVGTKIKC